MARVTGAVLPDSCRVRETHQFDGGDRTLVRFTHSRRPKRRWLLSGCHGLYPPRVASLLQSTGSEYGTRGTRHPPNEPWSATTKIQHDRVHLLGNTIRSFSFSLRELCDLCGNAVSGPSRRAPVPPASAPIRQTSGLLWASGFLRETNRPDLPRNRSEIFWESARRAQSASPRDTARHCATLFAFFCARPLGRGLLAGPGAGGRAEPSSSVVGTDGAPPVPSLGFIPLTCEPLDGKPLSSAGSPIEIIPKAP
jgi:hypothetical protein